MLYFRAFHDLAGVVRLVLDKVSAADRVQILTILQTIQGYLTNADVLSIAVPYDEPVKVLSNLIVTIEESTLGTLDSSKVITVTQQQAKKLRKSGHSVTDSHNSTSSVTRTPKQEPAAKTATPKVSRVTHGKKAPPEPESAILELSSDDGGDDYSVESLEQQTEDEGLKPIDMLEKALADIINENEEENTDGKYDPKYSLFTMREAEKPATKTGKSKENVKSTDKPKGLVKQERYLALDQPHVNPIPRIQDSVSRKRKWPTNAIWVCVYCRLITDDITSYKKHLSSSHKAECPCCCRYCKREFGNAELCSLHHCSKMNVCQICNMWFRRPNLLRRHMHHAHHKGTIVAIRCKICDDGTIYDSVALCAQHLYDDHENIVYCDWCSAECDPYQYKHDDPSRILCLSCAADPDITSQKRSNGSNPDIDIYKDGAAASFRLHTVKRKRTGEETVGKYKCECCEVTFSCYRSFQQHIKSAYHLQKVAEYGDDVALLYSCLAGNCKMTFTSEKALKAHHTKEHKSITLKYRCTQCDVTFVSQSARDLHMKRHMNVRDHMCDQCGKAFYSRGDLKNHVQWKHTEGKPHRCEKCGESFVHKKQLKRHVQVVHDRIVYRCPSCDYEARDGYILKTHMAKHPGLTYTNHADYLTTSDKPYVTSAYKPRQATDEFEQYLCSEPEDGVETEAKNESINVSNSAVEKKKGYKCPHCSKLIMSKCGFKGHLAGHANLREFKCPDCDASFNKQNDLSNHRHKHTQGKPHSCPKCEMAFKTPKILRRHIRVMHQGQVFQCPCCDHQAVEGYRLKVHMKSFHPDVKYTQSSDYITTTSDKNRLAKRSRSSNIQKNTKVEGTDIDSESDTDSENISLYSDEEEITDYNYDENVGTDCEENEEKVDDHNYTCKKPRTSARSKDALSDEDERIPLHITQVATVALEKLPLDAFNKMSK